MQDFAHIADVAQAIQLAVAPVFLLTGVGATLNVLATRIGRIIDRARIMEDALTKSGADAGQEQVARLHRLSLRAKLVNRAIVFTVLSGIAVAAVVAALFVSAVLKVDLSLPIAVAFVGALIFLAAALLFFLREVFLATESLRFGAGRV